MQIVVIDTRNLGRGFAGDAFPFVKVDDLLIFLPISSVIFRKPGMREVRRVVIGVDARIVSGELLHLVEAMLDRVELGLIPQMPLAREISRIAALREELGDCRGVLGEAILITRHDYDRKRGTNWDASGHE